MPVPAPYYTGIPVAVPQRAWQRRTIPGMWGTSASYFSALAYLFQFFIEQVALFADERTAVRQH